MYNIFVLKYLTKLRFMSTMKTNMPHQDLVDGYIFKNSDACASLDLEIVDKVKHSFKHVPGVKMLDLI